MARSQPPRVGEQPAVAGGICGLEAEHGDAGTVSRRAQQPCERAPPSAAAYRRTARARRPCARAAPRARPAPHPPCPLRCSCTNTCAAGAMAPASRPAPPPCRGRSTTASAVGAELPRAAPARGPASSGRRSCAAPWAARTSCACPYRRQGRQRAEDDGSSGLAFQWMTKGWAAGGRKRGYTLVTTHVDALSQFYTGHRLCPTRRPQCVEAVTCPRAQHVAYQVHANTNASCLQCLALHVRAVHRPACVRLCGCVAPCDRLTDSPLRDSKAGLRRDTEGSACACRTP